MRSIGFTAQEAAQVLPGARRAQPDLDDVLFAIKAKHASYTASALLDFGKASTEACETSSSVVPHLCAFPVVAPAKQQGRGRSAFPVASPSKQKRRGAEQRGQAAVDHCDVPRCVEKLMRKGTIPAFPPPRFLSFTSVPAAHTLEDAKALANEQLKQSKALQSSLSTLYATAPAGDSCSSVSPAGTASFWGTLPPAMP